MPSTIEGPQAPTDDRVRGLVFVAALVAVMWVVEIVDAVAFDLDSNGIRPRDVDGLVGVVLAPVLHGGFGHLIGNTIPFLVLGAAIALGGLARSPPSRSSSRSSAASARG